MGAMPDCFRSKSTIQTFFSHGSYARHCETVVSDDAVVCWKFTATAGSILHDEVSFARVRTQGSPPRRGGDNSQDIRLL